MPEMIAHSQEAQKELRALDAVQQLRTINGVTLAILKEAREGDTKDADLALRAIDRVQKQLELQAKLLGDLAQEGTTVNIWMSPEWTSARISLLEALRPFPEARVAVAHALLAIEGAGHGSTRPA